MSKDTKKTYVVDTNVLLEKPEVAYKDTVLILPIVLRELEQLERKKFDKRLQYQIREVKRAINSDKTQARIIHEENYEEIIGYIPKGYSKEYGDNLLLAHATLIQAKEGLKLTVLTGDVLLAKKAEALGINVEQPRIKGGVDYLGVYDFFYDDTKETDQEILSKIHTVSNTDMYHNPFELSINEYLIVWDKSKPTYKQDSDVDVVTGYKPLGIYRFDGKNYKPVIRRSVNSHYFGKVEPLNQKQIAAFDLMNNPEIKIKLITGISGSGKDKVQLTHCIDQLDRGEFDKLIWVRNNVEMKDTKDIGALPNSMEEKLKPFAMILADILGSETELDRRLDEGNIVIENLGFLRGRSFKNSIIYVSEVQNMTPAQIKSVISRAGEGTIVVLNGDLEQADLKEYETNNAIHALQALSGEKLFGQVNFDKTERSDVAQLAELID